MHPQLVQHLLEGSADCRPGKVALVCDGRRLTYGEVEAQANRLARALREHGLERGGRIVLWLPNGVELAVGIFAALKAGGTFVILHPATPVPRLVEILRDCEATTLIALERAAPGVEAARALAPTLRTILLVGERGTSLFPYLPYEQIQASYSAERLATCNIDLDLACLIYTSGSTGEPKGVMSDHSNVLFAAASIIQYLENRPSDVLIDVLPLSFDYGLYQLLMTFAFGGTLVLERGFAYPAAVLGRIAAERVTGFPGVPTLFAALLSMDLERFDLSSLRYLTNTAAALPPSHIIDLARRLPHARLYSMYGLTETKRTLYLPPAELERRPDSVGRPIPGTEAWIEDEAGRCLVPGEVGELVVRGRHVMRGYWNNPEASARRFRPGPLPGERLCYTGDLFRMDAEGFFFFVARQDDLIKSRGRKVAPKAVEDVLHAAPGVQEAAVVGVPDPLLGQSIWAFVVAGEAGVTEEALLAHCRAHLEPFMVPSRIEFRGHLPRTESGKIKKTGLV